MHIKLLGPVFPSPIYWSPIKWINLMFRIDSRSTVFHFSMHFRSPITWSLISWSAVNWSYFMPIWLADSDLNLRCCAKLPSMQCKWTLASKHRHSNDINDIILITCCQKYVLSEINMGASIHFISSQNTMHSINRSVVIVRHAWNLILMR